MAKKVFDILPPEKFEEKKEALGKEKPKFKLPEIRLPKLPQIRLKKKLIFVPSIILIVLISLFIFSFKFSKAEIKIWPETATLTFKTKLTADTKVKSPDFKNNLLPGKIFEAEKTISEEFSSSGKSLKKAEGLIRLYNSFTIQPETWLAGTRFVSSDGKLFKSKDKISVPGAEIKNGKIVPSFVDVPVIAAEGGSDYNIAPSHFSIIAFKGTPRYYKFYGESFQSMTGGGEVSQVTKEDLEKAENVLTEKLRGELKEILKSEIPAEFVFLTDASEIKILDKSSLAREGMEIEKFNFQLQAKMSTISFEREDIEKFAEQFILPQISKGKSIFRESLKIEYLPEIINFELGKIIISLNLSVKIYPEIDLQSLKRTLIGKSLAETKIFFENQPQIIKTEIHLFPFWLKSIPKDIEKIEIGYPIID